MFHRASTKIIYSVLMFALVSTVGVSKAFAEAAPPTPEIGSLPLNVGNVEIAGSASYTKNVRTNGRFLSIMPHAEYFFFNRFSAGGTVAYTDTQDTLGNTTTSIFVGPSATYYITHTARTAVSLDQSVLWRSVTGSDNVVQGATGLAFDYFFSSSIAFGPQVRGIYYFNGGLNKPDDLVQLAFEFSMFL